MSLQDRTLRPPRARVRTWRVLAVLAFVGCLGLASAPARVGAGLLSEAAKEALKPVEKQHPVPMAGPAPAPAVVATSMVVCSAPPVPLPPPLPPYPGPEPQPDPYHYLPEYQTWKPRPDLHVGTMVAVSELSSPDFAAATFTGIRAGISRGRLVFDTAFLAGPARFTAGSDVSRALQNPMEKAIEGSFRYSLTPPHSPFGVGPVVGLRGGRLTWRYLNPIQLETPELIWTVSDDAIWHYSPYLGIATTFVRTRHVDLGITALAGWRYYATESREGLTNDLFPDTRFREIRLEGRIVF